MGHGPFGTTRLAARDLVSASVLARAIVDQLTALDGPWSLTLDNLDADDLVAQLLMALLPNVGRAPVASVPFVELESLRHGVDLYTQNMRRQLRKAENRLATDGIEPEIQFARTEPEIRMLLPELDRIHIERDHAAGRASDLDDPRVRHLWHQLILAHTVGDQIEIATLGIGGAIVAYVVGIRDDTTYRVFDGHFDTAWARYSPGRLIEDAVLRHVVEDGRFGSVDWMLGVAAEKILVATGARKSLSLIAGSQRLGETDALEVAASSTTL
jgi:hypothetical protein